MVLNQLDLGNQVQMIAGKQIYLKYGNHYMTSTQEIGRIYTIQYYTINTGVRSSHLRIDAHSNLRYNSGVTESMDKTHYGVPQGSNAKMTRHELQIITVEHRATLSERLEVTQPIQDTTINMRQRNGWTTEIQKC